MSSSPPLYFLHISDTHIGSTKEYELYGCNSYTNGRRIVDAINALPTQPDFVIHTGDIVFDPNDDAYKLASQVFARLKAPIYFVTGNHDASKSIRQYLKMEKPAFSKDDANVLSYSFQQRGYKFITLDARGPDEIDPHGLLASHQFDFLRSEIAKDQMEFVVFVHFPPFRLDSMWFDESMLLVNGEQLHETLAPVRGRVRGVFFGHVHRGMQLLRDGILYSSVASTIGQFHAWPTDRKLQLDTHHPPCFNFVTLVDGKTIIKEHSIPSVNREP